VEGGHGTLNGAKIFTRRKRKRVFFSRKFSLPLFFSLQVFKRVLDPLRIPLFSLSLTVTIGNFWDLVLLLSKVFFYYAQSVNNAESIQLDNNTWDHRKFQYF
jgi:hypothetical protein